MSNQLNPLMQTLIHDVEILDAKSTISIEINGSKYLLGVKMDVPKDLLLNFLKQHGNQFQNIHTTTIPLEKTMTYHKTRDDVREMVIDAICETLDIRRDQQTITEDTNLTTELGMDSLIAVEFIVVLEQKFGLRWPVDDPTYMSFRTVREVTDMICNVLDID